jgi:hypothetical protein
MWTLSPGVPIGCKSPPKRGPYSMQIHTRTLSGLPNDGTNLMDAARRVEGRPGAGPRL